MVVDRISVSYKGLPCYDIVYSGDFNGLAVELVELGCEGRRLCIVTDSNVGPLYADVVVKAVNGVFSRVVVFSFEAGEGSKNLRTVERLYGFLISHGFDRRDVLLALGGGVVGDLAGFAAATYLRGVRFVQVPTSLLAMSDSSIGGKTGVDLDAYKNMVGAFHMPILAYMNLAVLGTLEDVDYYSGFGEIIKHAYIRDVDFLGYIVSNKELIKAKDHDALLYVVRKNCLIKKEVVERDPDERGERALLNFGHTVGHAVERLMDYAMPHGQCVSVGMVAAAYLSYKKGMIDEGVLGGLEGLLADFNLPTVVEGLDIDEVLDTTSLDKKKDGDSIRFILLDGIGNAVIDHGVSKDEIRDAVRYITR